MGGADFTGIYKLWAFNNFVFNVAAGVDPYDGYDLYPIFYLDRALRSHTQTSKIQ